MLRRPFACAEYYDGAVSRRSVECRDMRSCVHLNRKSYSGLSPVGDHLLGISTEAVFLLTRNCSSKLRRLNMPHEGSLFSLTSSRKPDCAKETGGPDHMNENLLWALDFIFGCRHRRLSQPFTYSRRSYEVCLDCGRQVPHSLEATSPQRDGPPQGCSQRKLTLSNRVGSRHRHRFGFYLIASGHCRTPASGTSSLHDASSNKHASGEDEDHESSRLQRTPRRQREKCS